VDREKFASIQKGKRNIYLQYDTLNYNQCPRNENRNKNRYARTSWLGDVVVSLSDLRLAVVG